MKLTHKLAGAVFIAGAGYLLYTKVLTPEAQASVERLAAATKDACVTLNEKVEALRGHVVEDKDSLPNVISVKEAWSELGY